VITRLSQQGASQVVSAGGGRLSRPRRILITGASGFIGPHFTSAALARGHRIWNVDALTYAAHRRLPHDGHPRYQFIHADIAELAELPPGVEVIVNFAAESHVDRSIGGSEPFIHSNVRGVNRLLELVRQTADRNGTAPLFVQISTDEVLGDHPPLGGFSDSAPFAPSNPYAATKCAGECLTTSHGRTYDLPYMITRSSNCYGPRQHPEKLVACVIQRLLDGRKVPIHGDGSHRRNWLHVEDNCEAIYTAIDRGEIGQIYQIASDEEYTVREIVTKIAAQFGRTYDDVIERCPDRPGADKQYALNCGKLKALGWRQRHHFDESLPAIIDSYRASITSSDVPVPESARITGTARVAI
jgi:dTDP-glucose 4,6-dehydratase